MSQLPHRSLVIVADVGAESFHVGDEAMLAANLDALRRHDPGVQITVIGRRAGAQHSEPALDDAGGLFLSGGGNLSSSWPELLRQRIVLMDEARRRGLPIVTGGQTIGPDLTAEERSALAQALADCQHVGVRELPSAALALQMGVPPNRLSYQPDDAFFLAGSPPAAEDLPASPDEPFVAITLDPTFDVASSRTCLRSLAGQLARIAAESGLRLAFLPHVGPLGSLGDEDGRVGAALCQLLQAQRVECALLPVMPPAQTVWVTQRAAMVVSSRYHPVVFGTAAGVPCLGIYRDAYTRIKLQGALAHVGIEDGCLAAAVAEEGGLAPVLRRLWDQREDLRAAMTRARAAIELKEERRWERLLTRLGWATAGETATPLGWPPEQLAVAALAALARERHASDAETYGWQALVKDLSDDCAALREGMARAEEFAMSLREENRLLRQSAHEAANYVRSLQEEMARLRQMREEAERYAKSLETERQQGPNSAAPRSRLKLSVR